MTLLVLTDGRGEEWVAGRIAGEMRSREPGLRVLGASLASSGETLVAGGATMVFCGRPPRSGGFPLSGLSAFLGDVGYVAECRRFVRAVRAVATDAAACLVVGDPFLLVLARAARVPRSIMIASAKSEQGDRHVWPEFAIMRRFSRLVLTRDAVTSAALVRRGVRAEYLGNPMMDLRPVGDPASVSTSAGPDRRAGPPVVLLLPGSRHEWPLNLRLLLDVARALPASVDMTCALADPFPEADAPSFGDAGWRLDGDRLVGHGRSVAVLVGRFAEAVQGADVAVGLAGTAHEQAVGMGVPVVTLVGRGPQSCARRMRAQERLLGGAARFAGASVGDAAADVTRLIDDPVERRRRGEIGRQRMGPPGASGRIADRLLAELRGSRT